MKCNICGAEIKEGAKFCENCGANVAETINTASEAVEENKVEEPVEKVERIDGEIVSEHHFTKNAEGQDQYTTDIPSANNAGGNSSANTESASSQYSSGAAQTSSTSYNSATSGTTGASSASAGENKSFAIASLVCGIVSLVCCCCCSFVSLICGGLAVGLGIFVLYKKLPGKEMAIAGIICGGLGLLSFIFTLIFGAFGITDGFKTPVGIEDIFESLDL